MRTLVALAALFAQGLAVRAQSFDAAAVVAKVEPSVACVIVSRSDWYKRFGLGPREENPGVLGDFTPADFDRIDPSQLGVDPFDQPRQAADALNAMRQKLDLSHPLHAPEAFGSGVVVDASGLVLTPFHVVLGATKIFVRLPGGKGSYADVHAADGRCDLAVLKLREVRGLDLKALPLAPLDAKRGEPVAALAHPLASGVRDGQASVSVGVVSGLRRRTIGRPPARELSENPLYQYGVFLQTDARIALGSSGGVLVNAKGECLGLLNAMAGVAGADAPGGFAMPLTGPLLRLVDVLKRGEEIDYGFLGVALDDHPAADGGAVVKMATPGTPAHQQAGLAPQDTIVSIEGVPVRDNQDLMYALGLRQAGDRVEIVCLRDSRERRSSATLVKYHFRGPTLASSLGKRPIVGGMRVDYVSLTSALGRFPGPSSGVAVEKVQKGSQAARLDFAPDDVITHVGGVPVATPTEFYAALAASPRPVDLRVRRGIRTTSVRWP